MRTTTEVARTGYAFYTVCNSDIDSMCFDHKLGAQLFVEVALDIGLVVDQMICADLPQRAQISFDTERVSALREHLGDWQLYTCGLRTVAMSQRIYANYDETFDAICALHFKCADVNIRYPHRSTIGGAGISWYEVPSVDSIQDPRTPVPTCTVYVMTVRHSDLVAFGCTVDIEATRVQLRGDDPDRCVLIAVAAARDITAAVSAVAAAKKALAGAAVDDTWYRAKLSEVCAALGLVACAHAYAGV